MADDEHGLYSFFFTFFNALADQFGSDAEPFMGRRHRHRGEGYGAN